MSSVQRTGVFARSMQPLFTAGALILLTCGIAWPVTGEVQSRELRAGSAWHKLCFEVANAHPGKDGGPPSGASDTVEACYTYLNIRHTVVIRDRAFDLTYAMIGVLETKTLNRRIFAAMLPVGPGMAPVPRYLLLQDGTRLGLSFLHSRAVCYAADCYFSAELSHELLEQIEAGAALSFGTDGVAWPSSLSWSATVDGTTHKGSISYIGSGAPRPGTGSSQSFSVPLVCCFAEAFAGDALPASAHDEMQRKIIEVLVRKFHDFIQ